MSAAPPTEAPTTGGTHRNASRNPIVVSTAPTISATGATLSGHCPASGSLSGLLSFAKTSSFYAVTTKS